MMQEKELEVKTVADLPEATESTVLQEEKDLNYIGLKEFKSLKKSRYGDVQNKYNKAFVIKNKRTGAIAEIRAATSFQACKFIGWKPKQVVLLETKDVEDVENDSNVHDDVGNIDENKE